MAIQSEYKTRANPVKGEGKELYVHGTPPPDDDFIDITDTYVLMLTKNGRWNFTQGNLTDIRDQHPETDLFIQITGIAGNNFYPQDTQS